MGHVVMRNPNCRCMKDGACSKRFPRSFNNETLVDEKGFPVYCRHRDARFVYRNRGSIKLDNQFVVPYNLGFLKRFQAHINVEWCNKSNLLKYLFKYVTKGADVARIRFRTMRDGMVVDSGDGASSGRNEIDEFIRCRYGR